MPLQSGGPSRLLTRTAAVLAGLLVLATIGVLVQGASSDPPASHVPPGSRYGAAAEAEADSDPALPGQFIDLQAIYGGFYGSPAGPTTASHVARQVDYASDCSVDNSSVCNSNPPAGGPHWSGVCGTSPEDSAAFCGPARWGYYRDPWEAETLVHNMEHGGVVIWYNTENQEIITELEQMAEARVADRDIIVMAPYPDMEDDTIAVTSWSRIDKFPVSQYTRERVDNFINVHLCRFNPEDLPGC